ncbi:efflux RND transporter permease subunit [Desulfobacula toluolica]|uniref:Predicted efflux transporter, AcrB/AcrD/AcrF family, permease n=1 Tax=Desulfobacula toluolica (strain DSM 7467 / Tol2) TaxID=651182 RepID=K0NDV6_DESTT|nr:efflux RND transporter permease subunit [Desulfobacula toluolica]CCK79081.1 predicted efflux transporter, AcrB/AcrD/AcrF family, permease [Desulfobacula toluolica Tol2]
MNNLCLYAVRYKVVTLVFSTIIALGGIFSFLNIGRLEDPEFTIKETVIHTHYPGASAKQVELEVTEPIETAIQQLKQLKEVRSISRAGVSIIFAETQEIYDKHNLPQVWDELRRKVGSVNGQLPAGCQTPIVNDDFGDVYGVLFAITGDGYDKKQLKAYAEDLRRELLTCNDVGRIDFWGLPREAVFIEIDRAKLTQLGLNPNTIFDTLNGQNSVTPAGAVQVGSEYIPFRITGDYTSIEDIANQLISGSEGSMIRLKEIARIRHDIITPAAELMCYNGKEAVAIGISTISGGNVISMGDSIDQRLQELQANTPFGINIHTITSQSKIVEKSVSGFVSNLISAVVIVILLLVVFMGWREGIIIGFVLILTIFATLMVMKSYGITLQRISLGALIIALGMLVDNAIVVTEGIIIKMRQGIGREEAADQSVKETMWPLLGATIIAILAFAAISLSKDMTGEWLASLFQVICISLGLSWFFAITTVPCFCVMILPVPKNNGKKKHSQRFFKYYKTIVGKAIDHRWLTLTGVIGLLVVAVWGFSHVKQDFMPDTNRSQFTVDIWMPQGTHINSTEKQLEQVEKYVARLEGVQNISGFIGRGPLRFLLTFSPEMPDSAYAQLLIDVDDFRRVPELKKNIQQYLDKEVPQVIGSVDAFKLGPGGGAVIARLSGPETKILRNLAGQVKKIMAENPNSRSIRTDWGNQIKVSKVDFADLRAQGLGISRPEIGSSIAMNFTGSVVGQYRHRDDLLPIILRPPKKQRNNIDFFDEVQVFSQAKNKWVPVQQVTNRTITGVEDSVIHRLNQKRTLRVLCKQREGTTDALFRQLSPIIEKKLKLPPGYNLEWGGEHEEQIEANTKLMSNFPIAFAGMFLVTVLLFNSLRYPLIIFMGLPLVVVGVAPGMLIADKAFGFMAMLGFLSLFGMLIKNEIVLLDQIKAELADGKEPFTAVVESSASRIRPVTMATFTTVLGMIPLLTDAFFSPMAATIMGGLSFATLLTLFVVPVFFSTLFSVRRPGVKHF